MPIDSEAAARGAHVVTSLVLVPADGKPLTAALAKQFIVLRLRPEPHLDEDTAPVPHRNQQTEQPRRLPRKDDHVLGNTETIIPSPAGDVGLPRLLRCRVPLPAATMVYRLSAVRHGAQPIPPLYGRCSIGSARRAPTEASRNSYARSTMSSSDGVRANIAVASVRNSSRVGICGRCKLFSASVAR